MKWVPFTAHIRIEPSYGSTVMKNKRFEYWRDMQKLSTFAYDELIKIASLIIANPGGGQQTSRSGFERGGMGGMTPGTAVKPQIGQNPSQLMITGFSQSSTPNAQPHPEMMVFHGGDAVWGAGGAHAWETNPESWIDSEVAALKTVLINALTTAFPAGTVFSVFRLDYSGVVYGDRGYTFPR